MNDVVKRSLEAAKIPSHLEPTDIYRSDGKRPDGASSVPWKGGRVLVWDATCPDTLAPSYSALATRETGVVAAEMNEERGQNTPILTPAISLFRWRWRRGGDGVRGRSLL